MGDSDNDGICDGSYSNVQCTYSKRVVGGAYVTGSVDDFLVVIQYEGKLGTNDVKRVDAGAHLSTPWLF